MAEPVKDECTICTWVLIAAGLGVAAVLGFMALDLAWDGKLSALLQRGGAGLASVTQLRQADDQPGDSDAG